MKQKLAVSKPEVTTFRGVRGLREILYELLDAGGKEHHTIGSPYNSTAIMGTPFWEVYQNKRGKMGIKAKLMFNESLREWSLEMARRGNFPNAEVRIMNFEIEPLTETIIRNDKIGFWSGLTSRSEY